MVVSFLVASRMGFSDKKIVNLVVFGVIAVSAIVWISFNNNLEPLKKELEWFYEAQLDSCEITNLYTDQFTGGRGSYQEFKTNCSHSRYPIFLDSDLKDDAVDKFQVGVLISKSKKSTELKLYDGNNEHILYIKPASQMDDRPFSLKIVSMFFGTFLIIALFIPNKLFDRGWS